VIFWILASAIGLIAALAMAWPLLSKENARRSYAIALVLTIPLLALFMYSKVGSPEGIQIIGTPQAHSESASAGNSDAQILDLTTQLEQRLQENPGDSQGWMLLGRTYKTMQMYDRAEAAMVKAYELSPDDPLIVVELAEARMFNSGNPEIGADIQMMLLRALELDPNQQKSLWLMGFAATQSGDDASAIEFWERLLGQMDPTAATTDSIQQQIDQARMRLGEEVVDRWTGFDIEVSLGDSAYVIPPSAILFVIARNPDAPGPPLGVRRIANPVFPLSLRLSDADSMMKELPISNAAAVQILARLSLSGAVTAGSDDPASELVDTSPNQSGLIQLELVVPGQ
jgi:cytochrome c-type biogenesis protein CcmH